MQQEFVSLMADKVKRLKEMQLQTAMHQEASHEEILGNRTFLGKHVQISYIFGIAHFFN